MSMIDKKLGCNDDLWTKHKTIHRKLGIKAYLLNTLVSNPHLMRVLLFITLSTRLWITVDNIG